MGISVISPPEAPMEMLKLGAHIYCRGRVYELTGFRNYTNGKRAVLRPIFGEETEMSVKEPFHLVNVTVTLEYVT